MKPTHYQVLFDDESGLQAVMAWDTSCEGAICCLGGPDREVALFPNKPAARLAIDISATNSKLLRLQGKPCNDDFLPEFKKCIKIVPCLAKADTPKPAK